jgi:hypothetical protein
MGESLVLAMEYVEGHDLAQVVEAQGPLPIARACDFIHQAALGLQHAFERGMVHRDIKPANLIVANDGTKEIVKVLDFGLAKLTSEGQVDSGLTREGQMLGTPDYIAPEQIRNAQSADIRADIYSLGCTFYCLLTGRPPFREEHVWDVYQAHFSMDAQPLNAVRPEVPVELAALVAKMMAKEPGQRFQVPAEVANELTQFVKNMTLEPAQATTELEEIRQGRRESSAAAAKSEQRRVRGSWFLAATAALGLIGGFFVVIWFTVPTTSQQAVLSPPNVGSFPGTLGTVTTVGAEGATTPVTIARNKPLAPREPTAPPPADDDEAKPAGSAADGAGLADTSAAAEKDTAEPAPDRLVASVTRHTPKRGPAKVVKEAFNPANLKLTPNKKFTLEKYVAAPSSYSGLVMPMGMYHLAHSPNDGANGARKFLAVERIIEARKNSILGVSSSAAIELEVEPRLADRLDKLGPGQLGNKVAILTLWFGYRGEYMLVKVDILEKFVLGFKKASRFPEGDIEYETLSISCEPGKVVKAIDDDWEQPARLRQFAHNYKSRISVFKRLLTQKETDHIRNEFYNAYQEMMRAAAAREHEDQQLRQKIGGN